MGFSASLAAAQLPLGLAFLSIAASFAAIYVSFAGGAMLLSGTILPRLGIGRVVDSGKLRDGQISKELRRSAVSILIFACYGVLTLWAYRLGVAGIRWEGGLWLILGQGLLLLLWNEAHFYACHRLLHTRWLYRHVHRFHHESVTPTPFSTYSFHWFEALLLGSVMILPMLFWSFHFMALISLPLTSLLFNTIGHWNYDVFAGNARSASVEHSRHHQRVGGNYGFYLPVLDRWLGTGIQK